MATNPYCMPSTIEVFAGEIPGYDWTIKDGTLGRSVTGTTGALYNRASNSVTTTIDSKKYTTGSNLAMARTILHESVHAYIVAYFGVTRSDERSYSQYVNDYSKSKDMNAAQHNEFVRNFVGYIANELKTYGNNQGYNLTDQYYNDLAWGGLHETNAFKAFHPDAQDRIRDVLSVEQTGKNMKGETVTPKGAPSKCN